MHKEKTFMKCHLSINFNICNVAQPQASPKYLPADVNVTSIHILTNDFIQFCQCITPNKHYVLCSVVYVLTTGLV